MAALGARTKATTSNAAALFGAERKILITISDRVKPAGMNGSKRTQPGASASDTAAEITRRTRHQASDQMDRRLTLPGYSLRGRLFRPSHARKPYAPVTAGPT